MSGLQLAALIVVVDLLLWLPVFLWRMRTVGEVPLSIIEANVAVISLNVLALIVALPFK